MRNAEYNNIVYFEPAYNEKKQGAVYEQISVEPKPTALWFDNKDIRASNIVHKEVADVSDWQEKYLDKLSQDIADVKASQRATEERVSSMVNQMLGELRDRDNQRHAEQIELRKDLKSSVDSVHAEIHQLESKIDENRKWWVSLMVTTAIGVAAIVVTLIVS